MVPFHQWKGQVFPHQKDSIAGMPVSMRTCSRAHGTKRYRMQKHAYNTCVLKGEGAVLARFVIFHTWLENACLNGTLVHEYHFETDVRSVKYFNFLNHHKVNPRGRSF